METTALKTNKKSVMEIQNLLNGLSNRVEMAEESIRELQDRATGFIRFEQPRENRWKQNEQNLSDLRDNKRFKIHVSV